MQQSRLLAAGIGARSLKSFSLLHHLRSPPPPLLGFAVASSTSSSSTTGRLADPAFYSKERDHELQPAVPTVAMIMRRGLAKGRTEIMQNLKNETKNLYQPDIAKRETEAETEHRPRNETDTLSAPKLPHAPCPRLASFGACNPAEPILEQRRRSSSTSSLTLQETICAAGVDGTDDDRKVGREEDELEYYRQHKASPLSEIKVADTRKPITRATDGTADPDEEEYGLAGDVIKWRPEQLDTAEEALERAQRIWRENGMRGDPDSPHGRVLRILRGEWF